MSAVSPGHAHTLTAHALSTAPKWVRTRWRVTKPTLSTQGCYSGVLRGMEMAGSVPCPSHAPPPLRRKQRRGKAARRGARACAHASRTPPPVTAPQCSAPEAHMAAGDRRPATGDWGEIEVCPLWWSHAPPRPAAPAGEGREPPPPGATAALLPPRPLSSQYEIRSAGALQPSLRPGRAGLLIGCGSCRSWRGPIGSRRGRAGPGRWRRARGSGAACGRAAPAGAVAIIMIIIIIMMFSWLIWQGPAAARRTERGSPSEPLRAFPQGVSQTQVRFWSFTDRSVAFLKI